MAGKACIITGATSGIGRAVAYELGARGANLAIMGRNEVRGREIVARILRQSPASKVRFFRCDLTLRLELLAVAQAIREEFESIDVLVNNAGARFDVYRQSSDGHELTFATNHLSHFLLTALLLDGLLQAPAGRIITVASGSHGSAVADGKWQFTAKDYDRRQAYARSKLANLLFARELARRLTETQVVSNAVDPGGVASNFARNNGLKSWARHLFSHALRRELVSPRRGAEGIVYLASSPAAGGDTGKYFHGQTIITSSPASQDRAAAQSLWELSVALTGLNEQLGAAAWTRFKP